MLRVDSISVFYGEVQALWDVSFEVNEGEIVTLVGSNGAGKTTTLKTISGLLPLAAQFSSKVGGSIKPRRIRSSSLALRTFPKAGGCGQDWM
jgi:branched-chain amino acid transport system ATP-binding protein